MKKENEEEGRARMKARKCPMSRRMKARKCPMKCLIRRWVKGKDVSKEEEDEGRKVHFFCLLSLIVILTRVDLNRSVDPLDMT